MNDWAPQAALPRAMAAWTTTAMGHDLRQFGEGQRVADRRPRGHFDLRRNRRLVPAHGVETLFTGET